MCVCVRSLSGRVKAISVEHEIQIKLWVSKSEV